VNITTANPAEIDTEIARLEGEQAQVMDRLHRVRRLAERSETDAYHAHLHPVDKLETEASELNARMRDLLDALVPLTEEYTRRGGWSRYYLVTNSNGHLHTTTACRNTYATTEFYWVTELSGATADEAVARGGARSCLDCFPQHRELIESGRPCKIETPERRKARVEREAQEAAKAEKLAKTGITNPDGSPLKIRDYGDHHVLKTEVAASRCAVQSAFCLRQYGMDDPDAPAWKDNVDVILPALAHKRGTTVEAERAALDKKVEAKSRREMW
jgi:hypothetical protein